MTPYCATALCTRNFPPGRALEAAHDDAEAKTEFRNAVLITVIAGVARNYLDIRCLQMGAHWPLLEFWPASDECLLTGNRFSWPAFIPACASHNSSIFVD